MQKKQILKGSLTAAATLSMLVACGPTPNTSNPSPSPSASATAMPSATAEPTAEPSAEPTATAMPSATAEPTAMPTASTDPSASPTPVPSATATDDISVIENTTFNGKVYDDDNTPLSGVTVTVKSLNSSVPYEATASTVSGTYAFNNAPAGVQLEIVASRDGYATRRRVEVLKSNKTGDPNANRYDFGTDGSDSTAFGVEYNALSDKPEVVAVTPARNASGISPDTTFVLEFSESMDTDTVEENFAIHTSTDEELTVEAPMDGLNGVDQDPDDGIGGSPSLIWDEGAFDISWNSDDTQVTFTFQDDQQLPTDTESSNVPDYLVTFSGSVDDGQLKDASGVTRDAADEGAFKLTDGNFEFYYEFSIDTDEDEPQVDS
ncbi:MAG: carboxypeptidase regulatory-like domain-containing protein, partial [Candidatus Sericytochromatia bacterium]